MNAWGATQHAISLSSGEAEYYGMVKGTAMDKGTQAILADMGLKTHLQSIGHSQVRTDSSAAKGLAARTGLGNARHIEGSQLWVQP